MRTRIRNVHAGLMVIVVMIFSGVIFSPPVYPQVISSESISQVAENCIGSVVNISSTRIVTQNQNTGRFRRQQIPQESLEQALGSGVVIDSNGTILTNNHVVESSRTLDVTLYDGRTFHAELIATDAPSDIAVIKLVGDGIQNLKPLPFGDSESLMLGEVVLAIGNPFGLGNSVSMGIVSAKGRNSMGIEDYENFIQTDAAVNPGNSGGALINMKGELIGINTAIESQSGGSVGISFAIPSNMAHEIMTKLMGNGKVVRGTLGVGIQDMSTDLAAAFGTKPNAGVLVASLSDNSPAQKAGIRIGDVILRINSTDITNSNQFLNMVAMLGSDVTVNVTLLRDGRQSSVSATLIELQEQPVANTDSTPQRPQVQLTVSPLTSQLRSQLDIPADITGVVVTDLGAGNPLSMAGIQPGYVICEVNRKPVDSVSAFNSAYGGETGKVLLLLYVNGENFFIVVDKSV